MARKWVQLCISTHSGASEERYAIPQVATQKKPLTRLRAAFRGRRTERAGFEPAVGVVPLRRFSKPLTPSHNSLSTKAVAQPRSDDLARHMARIMRDYPELATVIEAWPDLTSEIREAVQRMVSQLKQRP